MAHYSLYTTTMGTTALGRYLSRAPRGEKARIARASGLAYSTVHWIAAGRARPKVETARRIAEATDGRISAAQILGLADQPEAAE